MSIPVSAIYRGRKVRVVGYEGEGRFLVLDWNDQYRVVDRENLVFPADGTSARKEEKK